MSNKPYKFNRLYATRYVFTSFGRKPLTKVVEFIPTGIPNLYNLGFGDLSENGIIDDTINSNNGDIQKVLTTIIHIIKDFTFNQPEIKIVFTGSSTVRTALYQRILKTYHHTFIKEFYITALQGNKNASKEVVFDPDCNEIYLAFFVKRIN